ncbi:DUF421 domain-containing protein [Anditalea andensis]|uniref:YetF C-terminal domain-containing protein n=1 Tax=Anditalea andensis TaxID=1048983 RepID=A0A074L2Z0_9BACT|nr:YetF domain-containing protein [Anditalea andensis]KEO75549.1 hypothetical protein EL17_00200 [Anditalea andensis]
MDREDIRLDDWERLLMGTSPWEFTIEIFIRTLIIYFFLMLVMRLLGKRMNAQLNITDLAVMLTLGAIASVPMQDFNAGILPGILLLASILMLHQGFTLLSYKKRKIEELTVGKMNCVIKNGLIDTGKLSDMRISKDQIFSILRTHGVHHLGQVKRMYSESDGQFSVYKFKEPRPGFSVYPRKDGSLPPSTRQIEDQYACAYCGNLSTKPEDIKLSCGYCANNDWVEAIQ